MMIHWVCNLFVLSMRSLQCWRFCIASAAARFKVLSFSGTHYATLFSHFKASRREGIFHPFRLILCIHWQGTPLPTYDCLATNMMGGVVYQLFSSPIAGKDHSKMGPAHTGTGGPSREPKRTDD